MRPLSEIQGVIFDLDGTVYRGECSIPGVHLAVERMCDAGLQLIYLSNNASDTRTEVTGKLIRHGLPTAGIPVITGTSLLASYLRHRSNSGKVLVVGEPGLRDEIAMIGWECVMAGSPQAEAYGQYDAVAVGCDRYFTYDKLNQAHQAIVGGAFLVATDRDSTYPTEWGTMPGTGAVLAGIECSAGVQAELAGKPSRFAAEQACAQLSLPLEACLIVGDRLDSDIALGDFVGASALVLTGVTTSRQAAQSKDAVPDMVCDDLPAVAEVLIAARVTAATG